MSDDLIARLRDWDESLPEYDEGGIESYLMVKDARRLIADLADALAAERALADQLAEGIDALLAVAWANPEVPGMGAKIASAINSIRTALAAWRALRGEVDRD